MQVQFCVAVTAHSSLSVCADWVQPTLWVLEIQLGRRLRALSEDTERQSQRGRVCRANAAAGSSRVLNSQPFASHYTSGECHDRHKPPLHVLPFESFIHVSEQTYYGELA